MSEDRDGGRGGNGSKQRPEAGGAAPRGGQRLGSFTAFSSLCSV